MSSAIIGYLCSCDTLHYRKRNNKIDRGYRRNRVRSLHPGHRNHVIVDAYAEVCIIPAAFTYLSIALQLVHISETHVTAELTIYMKSIILEVNKLSLKTV